MAHQRTPIQNNPKQANQGQEIKVKSNTIHLTTKLVQRYYYGKERRTEEPEGKEERQGYLHMQFTCT